MKAKHGFLIALALLVSSVALGVPVTLNNLLVPHQQTEASFPTTPASSAGAILFGTTSGIPYYSPGDGGTFTSMSAATAIPVVFPPVLVNAALTVATLGGYIATKAPKIDAVQFYVSVAGTVGSTNVNVRATNGTINCDFAFACNTAIGAKRVAGSGSGCTGFAAGDAVTVSVTSLGDCATPATFLGNLSLEGNWR